MTGLPDGEALAAEIHRVLRAQRATVAVAESLTGGLLGAVLTATAGSSLTFRGGVVAYATDLKAQLLDVEPALLDRHGAVHPDVALAMARGARTRLAATYGVATTGVAGPDAQDGRAPGTVHVAAVGPAGERVDSPAMQGDRARVRAATVLAALRLLRVELVGEVTGNPEAPR